MALPSSSGLVASVTPCDTSLACLSIGRHVTEVLAYRASPQVEVGSRVGGYTPYCSVVGSYDGLERGSPPTVPYAVIDVSFR